MKTNSNFTCGLPSSRLLHRPEVRRANKLARINKSLIKAAKVKEREDKHQAELDATYRRYISPATQSKAFTQAIKSLIRPTKSKSLGAAVLVILLNTLLIHGQDAPGQHSGKARVSVSVRYVEDSPRAKQVTPFYPPVAYREGIEGEYTFAVTVREGVLVHTALILPHEHGEKRKCCVLDRKWLYRGPLSPYDMSFIESVKSALKLWMFESGTNSDFEVTVRFTID